MTNPSPASSKWSWRKRLLVGALATFAVMQLVPYGRDHPRVRRLIRFCLANRLCANAHRQINEFLKVLLCR